MTRAMLEWAELRMPFEAATLRLEIAAAHRVAGNPRSAELEQTAACRMFEALGAPRWIEIACERAAASPPPAAGPAKQACVFRRVGDMRTACFAGTEIHLKDLKGMRYLERLLLEPGARIPRTGPGRRRAGGAADGARPW